MTPQRFRLFMFGDAFGLSQLQADPNVVLIQDPSAIWGGADMLASGATETQKYQHAATKNVPWLRRNMLTYTNADSTSGWAATGLASIGASVELDPLGNPCGRFIASGTGNSAVITTTTAPTALVGQTYYREFYIKPRSANKYIQATMASAAFGTSQYANIMLEGAGSVTYSTGCTCTVSASSNGFYLIKYSAVATAAAAANGGIVYIDTPDAPRVPTLNPGAAKEYSFGSVSQSVVADCPYQHIPTTWPATYTALAQAAGYQIAMYADRAGTTAVDTPDTVVGVQLDLSEGLVLGPELITGWDFTSSAGWVGGNGWSVAGGKGVANNADNGYSLRRGASISSGKRYRCTLDVDSLSGTLGIAIGQVGVQAVPALGPNSFDIFAGSTDAVVRIIATTQGTNAVVDNFSVREILGNHATAPSDAARPLLKKNAGGYWYLLRDGADDNLPITFPNLGSNCVTYVCDGTQVIKTTSVTLNGAHNMTTPTNDYGRIYCAAPPTAAREAQIIKYLKAKAGLS